LSRSRDVTVTVPSFAAGLGLKIDTGDGHTSHLSVTNTSLGADFIFTRAASALTLTLTTDDGAVLDDSAGAAEPLVILLERSADVHDVTNMFSYTPATNTLALNSTSLTAFRSLLDDQPMFLRISSGDSVGSGVDVSVPLINGRFQVLGTTSIYSGATEPLAGSILTLSDLRGGYTAAATLAADGSFSLDDVPGGSYSALINTSGGLLGTAFLELDSASANTANVSIQLFDANANLEALGPGSALASSWPGFPTLAPTSTPMSSGSVSAAARFPLRQTTFTVPMGTKVLSLAAFAQSGVDLEHFFYHDGHPCNIAEYNPSITVADTNMAFMVLLNDRVVVVGGATHCGLPMNGAHLAGASLLDVTLDVSYLTRSADAKVRLVASAAGSIANAEGIVSVTAGIQPTFTITRVTDRAGAAAPVLSEVSCVGDRQPRKFLGVPAGTKPTHVSNRWSLRVEYQPSDATIQSVRLLARSPGSADEELSFVQPSPGSSGVLTLQNVGFLVGTNPRPMWSLRMLDASIVVEIQAVLPDGTPVTRTENLGKDIQSRRPAWRLTPLYDAGDMPVPSSRRFSGRDEQIGGDGWSVRDTFAFLGSNTDLVFNDESREHGGPFPPHSLHQCGVSIDTRYFGANGNSNPMNGTAGDVDSNNRETGAARRNRLLQAQNGNGAAQAEMVAWIRANRTEVDFLIAAHSRIRAIYVGNASWNKGSLLDGLYENGTEIIDPQTGQPIGSWAPAMVRPTGGHLNHVHIERSGS
jgi:hypothetical protein